MKQRYATSSSTVLVGILASLLVLSIGASSTSLVAVQGRLRRGEGRRGLLELEGFGGTPNAMYMPLGECQGDCDTDEDCKGSLQCFQREPGDAVPGCEGGKEAMSRTDYCYQPDASLRTDSGGSSGSVAVQGSSKPAGDGHHNFSPREKDSGTPVFDFGADPKTDSAKLKECEGDCDEDGDCASGLICFQREAGDEVPGCEGTPSSKSDFCVEPDRTSGSSASYVFSANSDSNGGSSNAAGIEEEATSAGVQRTIVMGSLATIVLSAWAMA